MRTAVIGGGIAGLAAAYELAGAGADFVVYEASDRFGGIVETVHQQGFVIECGPDAWVTEKPWARELAVELGLESELLPSNDATRKTYIAGDGRLTAIPNGMRMMVPSDLTALDASALFSENAKRAFRDEVRRAEALKQAAPSRDESVAAFVERHFGGEVSTKIAAPLLAGVFGGDITQISVRSVMPAFVKMEREHGSLIRALQVSAKAASGDAIFTTLTSGMNALIDRMIAKLPPKSLRLNTPVNGVSREGGSWRVAGESFESVIVATPADVTSGLVWPIDEAAAALLPRHASSAVVVALGFDVETAKLLRIPAGFGFLVPQDGEQNLLLAATFTHQKFARRAPEGAVLLRAFFGGAAAESLIGDDASLVQRARIELARYLGSLPSPDVTVVRRWPRSLPQYEVGHQERIAEFEARIAAIPGLKCIGNAYHGVGLPDLVREGRAAARNLLAG
jgi:oxygen-dependent protoporphyrinogen oxidase